MVINSGGGNKGKHVGRKFVKQGASGTKTVRVAQDQGEMYATVSKMLGNCMCGVLCYDGRNRLCIIRKKFTGRRKTDNIVSAGGLVLVGVHDYGGTVSGGGGGGGGGSRAPLQRCDLLYVYNDQEREKLRNVCDFSKLAAVAAAAGGASAAAADDDDNIKFITSGTGIFNKYANRDARGASVATTTDSTASYERTDTIGGADWLKDMYIDSDDDDGDSGDGDSGDGESGDGDSGDGGDGDDDSPSPQPAQQQAVRRAPRADAVIINVDDI